MINVLSLILLNIVYFVCNIYPKHIIEVNSPLSISILAIIINLLFYLLFSLFLVISINKNKNIFSEDIFPPFEKLSKRFQLNRILFICAVQILFDIIVMSLSLISNKNILYIIDFFTILIWIIIYNICSTRKNNIFRNKKGYFVVIGFVFLLIITSYFNYNIIEEYSYIVNKYSIDSTKFKVTLSNLDFLFGIKNFLLDTISGVILLILHFAFKKSCDAKPKEYAKQMIRVFLLFVFAFLLICFKFLVLPYSYDTINVRKSETKLNSELELFDGNTGLKTFHANTETTTIKRIDSDFSGKIVFQITNNKLFYKGELILEYNSNDTMTANYSEHIGNKIFFNDPFEKKVAGDIEFYLYKNEIICFSYDNTPAVVWYGDTQENYIEDLVTIYENLIINNNWEFFEQGAEYLFKYNIEFIEPYLERFCSGGFNEAELKSLEELSINKDYIQQLSKRISNNGK